MELGSSARLTLEEGVAKGIAAVHKREEEDYLVGRLICTSEADRPAILAKGSAADNMQQDVADAALSHLETRRLVLEREQIPNVAARHCEKQLQRGRRATTRAGYSCIIDHRNTVIEKRQTSNLRNRKIASVAKRVNADRGTATTPRKKPFSSKSKEDRSEQEDVDNINS
ncbi:hypothetical protein K504DRAFT_451810 [Pleomassaria siparia CBS 279.74]|uniref:Uncharacterized protein n=1 Tax=Pleomassaria siparia CBS 279.74 TaxID=1314801 RepID=A0A6G1JRR3_9PLEO|nr:hypothetical protein K504DRAFT_451810 [Pleomassaria siparia CBS 279.74]